MHPFNLRDQVSIRLSCRAQRSFLDRIAAFLHWPRPARRPYASFPQKGEAQ